MWCWDQRLEFVRSTYGEKLNCILPGVISGKVQQLPICTEFSEHRDVLEALSLPPIGVFKKVNSFTLILPWFMLLGTIIANWKRSLITFWLPNTNSICSSKFCRTWSSLLKTTVIYGSVRFLCFISCHRCISEQLDKLDRKQTISTPFELYFFFSFALMRIFNGNAD